ncbi:MULTISPECIES: TolC family protein [unclassified Variovorax]|uniref:TolC family protein n=1 Tax=unclassified Variovorax TaxID=663243 RepID=UPI000F7E3625|nr:MULTISPECIES: TolC family protein [unclassified Variovorax]RSZ39909.1 TolC family protein [Variovorax sp. 553]RSZ40384.1 TolC family protein [Variovorax sp. 679]
MSILFPRAAVLAVALLPYLATAAPLSLEEALAIAVKRSESTRAARAGALSATEAAHSAAQLPDPTLRVGIDNLPATGPDRFRTTRDSMTMKRIGISQEWLSADKRAARQAAADAAVGRETVLVQAAAADTRRQTALAYIDAFYANESLKLAKLMEHHAHEELEASRARLSSATGNSQEALALASARGTSEDETADVLQQQGAAGAAFQRWVGVMPDELQPPGAIALPTEEAYVAAHPTVSAMQRDLEVARRTAAVTASDRKPNWTWEIAYGQRTGYSDMVSVGVSIPLPVAPGERQDRDTAAKLALVEKAEADLAEASRAATAEYRSLRSDAQRLEQRIDRYRTGVVVPAGQRTAAATASYSSGQGSLVSLFEARHAEVEAQRKLLTLQRDLAKTQIQLAFRPLTAEVAQ